jgi:hypothetical protein
MVLVSCYLTQGVVTEQDAITLSPNMDPMAAHEDGSEHGNELARGMQVCKGRRQACGAPNDDDTLSSYVVKALANETQTGRLQAHHADLEVVVRMMWRLFSQLHPCAAAEHEWLVSNAGLMGEVLVEGIPVLALAITKDWQRVAHTGETSLIDDCLALSM